MTPLARAPSGDRLRALNLAGLGLRSGHLTPEVQAVLADCNRVYYLHADRKMVDRLSGLPIKSLVDISHFYRSGTSRLDTYFQIASQVIYAAYQDPPVAVALYGHPMVFSTLSSMLIAGAARFGVDVEVYPGVSSVDAILAALRIDPGQIALQVHEATELLAFARPLDRHSGLLIFQVSQLGTRIHGESFTPSDVHITQLADRLAAVYGSDHEVTAIEAPSGRAGWAWRGAVSSLHVAAASFPPSVTLYVPPLTRPPVRDHTILRGLDDLREADPLPA